MGDGSQILIYFLERKCIGYGLNIDGLMIFGSSLTEHQIKKRFDETKTNII